MEESFKIRNLLQEFLSVHDVNKPTILGLREHIFTGRYIDGFILFLTCFMNYCIIVTVL